MVFLTIVSGHVTGVLSPILIDHGIVDFVLLCFIGLVIVAPVKHRTGASSLLGRSGLC